MVAISHLLKLSSEPRVEWKADAFPGGGARATARAVKELRGEGLLAALHSSQHASLS